MLNDFSWLKRVKILDENGDLITNNNPFPIQNMDFRKILWTSDDDFGGGSLTNIEIKEIDDSAYIQIEENMDNDDDILYDVLANYAFSNGAKITVDENNSNNATLKILTGASENFPFTNPANYIIADETKLQVFGGETTLIVTNVLGHWMLNESSGSTISDSSGAGNDGIAINMEDGDWIVGKLNNALLFGGTDEYVNLGNIADFERTDSFSIEFWFKTLTSSPEMIMSKMLNSGTFRGWNIFIENGSITTALISDNASINRLQLKTNSAYNNGTFHHCVITYNGSSDISGLNIYIDGVDVPTTTVTNNLSSTISNNVDCQISGRNGSNLVFNGTIDEVIIYEEEISISIVTSRYNLGTGTETLFGLYPTDNPTIINNTGFVFSTSLNGFTETATKPNFDEIKYQISSDDGTTYKWWNGSSWVAITGSQTDTWYYENESNLASEVNTNIGALSGSGTFKFLAFLHSDDGTTTPALDNIFVGEPVTYSTDDNLYIDTKNISQITPATILSWLTTTISNILPTNTDIKLMFSNDGRVSWLTYTDGNWQAPINTIERQYGTSITDAETHFSTLPLGNEILDIRLFLFTSDNSASPSVSNINILSDTGFPSSGTYESQVYDSTYFSLDWGEVNFTLVLPSGGTIIITVRASNDSGDLGSYGMPLSSGSDFNISGRYMQWKAVFATSVLITTPVLNDISVRFTVPIIREVRP